MALPPVSNQNFQGLLPELDPEEESTGNGAESAGSDAEPTAPPASALPMITNPQLAALLWERQTAASLTNSKNANEGSSQAAATGSGSSRANPAPAKRDAANGGSPQHSTNKSSGSQTVSTSAASSKASGDSGGLFGWMEHAASDVSSTVKGVTQRAADEVSSAAKSAADTASTVSSALKGAVEQGASDVSSAVASAAKGIADAKRAADGAVEKAGEAIDSSVKDAEQKVDSFRGWLSEHGGVVGKVAAADIGFTEGVANSVYDMGKGLVQMGYGASQLLDPLEWAANPQANLNRLESTASAVKGMAQLANLANPAAWIDDPKGNAKLASALWNSAAKSFEEDPAKFLGNAAGTVATFFIPGAGEAGAAADVARATEVAGDAGKAARAATAAEDAAKVAGTGADAAKAARSTSEAGKAVEAGKASETGATSTESVCNRPGFCFVAGTLVHTARGLVPIEDVRIGEMVLSQDEMGGGDRGYRTITERVSFEDKAIFEIKFDSSDGSQETLLATPNHPFWVQGAGWRALELVEAGQKLQLSSGKEARVVSVRDVGRTERVFNFTVDDFHTYYVGQSGVWVHNTNCREFTPEEIKDFKKTGLGDQEIKALQETLKNKPENIRQEFIKAIKNDEVPEDKGLEMDWKAYTEKLHGKAPEGMKNPHAHHILFKRGSGEAQKALVREGQGILREAGINPIFGKENLVWAPFKIAEQHGVGTLEHLVQKLRVLKTDGADRSGYVKALEEAGRRAAWRT